MNWLTLECSTLRTLTLEHLGLWDFIIPLGNSGTLSVDEQFTDAECLFDAKKSFFPFKWFTSGEEFNIFLLVGTFDEGTVCPTLCLIMVIPMLWHIVAHIWKIIDRQAQMLKIYINHFQVMGLSSIFICLLWQAIMTSQVMWPWEGVQRQEKYPNLKGLFFLSAFVIKNSIYFIILLYFIQVIGELKSKSVVYSCTQTYFIILLYFIQVIGELKSESVVNSCTQTACTTTIPVGLGCVLRMRDYLLLWVLCVDRPVRRRNAAQMLASASWRFLSHRS